MTTRTTRLTMLGLALGVLFALLIAPQTRWLVRSQVLPPSLVNGHHDAQRRQFVRNHPDDYSIQLAGQTDGNSQTQLQYARSLVARFPDNASLRANILRYASARVYVFRDEDYLLQGQPVPPHRTDPNRPPATSAELAAFDSDAAAGERLDPENAYFPLMRSVGYFAAHRDAEGQAAVQRASAKYVWREYMEDEVESHWRINENVYGGREAIASMAFSASVLFPHYQHMRSVARLMTYKAVLEEQAGHPEAGLALRREIARCGQLMATQSTALIGNLVGVAITSVARGRPGGIPPVTSDSHLSGDQRAQQRLDAYCAYVTKISHPDAATEAQAQFQTWQQIHNITAHINDYTFGGPLQNIVHLTVALVLGWVTVPNILNLLLLGLLATALYRLPRVREHKSLPPGTTVGVWATLLLAFGLAALYFNTDWGNFEDTAALLILPPLAIVLLTAALLPRLRSIIFSMLRAALITATVLGLYGAVAAWLMHGGADVISTLRQTLALSGSDPNDNGTPSDEKIAQIQRGIGLLFGLAVPLLLALILSIAARVRRVPVSAGLVEGFRLWTPLLVCVLMFAYGGLILWTVQKEREVNYGLEQSLHGEGQYLAKLTGQAWPG